MNQDTIQKNYYEQLMVGHYIDVLCAQNQWKMAKILQRDKRYALVTYDGINSKEDQIYLHSFKVAPLRMQTQGYTGWTYKPYRKDVISINDYKNHLQILQQTYLKENTPNAFTTTQYLRGQLFVVIHSLLYRQQIKEEEAGEVMKFLIGFIQFVVKLGLKIKKISAQYFEAGSNKHLYLVNQKVALVNSFGQMNILLNLILKADTSKSGKNVLLFKSRYINQETLIKFFFDLKEETVFTQLFKMNDGNGKWLSFSIHKHLYFLIKKYIPKFVYPGYSLKDYQQVLSIYPFIIKEEQKQNKVEQQYINFIMSSLKEQTSFQAKLKCLQQLKKIMEEQIKLYRVDNKQIHSMIGNMQVIDHMLNQYYFNPQIFKRFIPILQSYCKVKSFSTKNIQALFKLASHRHESQVSVIHQIIYSIAEFIQVEALDLIYSQIIKGNINSQSTLKFIKNFTIKAIANYSKQKSFFTSLFKKSKNSNKYGYYGLDLFFKQLQDEGAINQNFIILVMQMIKEILGFQLFKSQRITYINTCVNWLQKVKNCGQAIKLIDNIISTFSQNELFSDTKRSVLQKLIQKSNLITLITFNLKKKKITGVQKMNATDLVKIQFQFIDKYYQFLNESINLNHIEYLWSLGDSKLISNFLKKGRQQYFNNSMNNQAKKKYIKRIEENIQEDILKILIKKPYFFQRTFTIDEFQALDQIFMSYNLIKKKIEITERGILRYIVPELDGFNLYFQCLVKLYQSPHIEKIIRKTINVFLRPKDQKNIQVKINTWKMGLLKLVQKLRPFPQICLKTINIFFEMIEGRMTKDLSLQGNIDVVITNDGQQRIITLAKISTIFRLRKQIMIQFNIHGDFSMYNFNMRRDINFYQEEQFSLNVLPLQSRGPSIAIVNRRKEKHPHFVAVQKFKQMIEKQESFYTLLFQLNNQKIHQLFWKTVDLLPVNRQLVRKIQNCTNFNSKEWSKILKTDTKQSLQYHLNIIYQLMEKNKKWISLFYSTEGMIVVLECLKDEMKLQSMSERIVNRCLLILIKMLETIGQIESKITVQLNLTLINKLKQLFSGDLGSVVISIELVNHIFNILNKSGKFYKQNNILQLQILLKILQFGIFKSKSKETIQFIQNHFEHYLINCYSDFPQKIKIHQFMLRLLNTTIVASKQYSELMFIFFIDYMNTFAGQEHLVLQKQEYTQQIKCFVMQVLNGPYQDQNKFRYNHLIFGTLKILLFTLNFKTQSYDIDSIFQILLKKLLLNPDIKRIKHDTTTKLVYQCLKKLLFMKTQLITILIDQIGPKLKKNEWRKNSLSDWAIESKRQERNVFCGLQNLGATCYINCLFQQLFAIDHFRQNFLSINSQDYKPLVEENQMFQLQNVFASLKYSSKRSISIKKFCDAFITYEGVSINPMVQSDSDQFYNALMEKIETFLKQNQRHDIIENTFEGKLSNQLNCEGCPHKSQKYQNFMSIGVNIRGKKCLEEALQGFVQGEILDGDNAYFCEICQKKVRTTKRLCIKQLPNILVIVLKRFEFNYDEMRKIKINSYLNFPINLNMKKFTAQFLQGQQGLQDQKYDYSLRGTVIHSGTSQGGHYYSFARANAKWYGFNDEFVEEINVKKIEQDGFGGEDKSNQADFKFQKYKNAYILFYEKQIPSETYSKECKQINNPFMLSLKKQILTENNNADFLSVMLDGNFIRLCQNLCVLQSNQAFKFTLLYFHTVVLRDRNKDEHIPNFYRIIDTLLKKEEVSEWYINQMNHRFFKQFLIQSPRTVRFVCTSLMIQAIKNVKKVPQNIINHSVFCMKKHGMTPFALIFKQISKRSQQKDILIKLEYPQRVIGLALQKSNNNFVMLELQSFESYFGADSSQKQKDRQICYSSLIESLKNFDVPFPEALQLFQKHYFRNGSKILASILANSITEDQIDSLFGIMQGNLIKQNQFKRQDIEKYMFLIRYICIQADSESNWRIKKSIESLKRIIYEVRNMYEPMQTIIRQLTYIAARNKNVQKKFKHAITDKENSIDLHKCLKFWLKDAEKPQLLPRSQQFKRRISGIAIEDRYQFQAKNLAILNNRMSWFLQKQSGQYEVIQSDIQDLSYGKELTIRSKRFKIKEHLGLIKKIEIEGVQRWAILQKADIDIYQSL